MKDIIEIQGYNDKNITSVPYSAAYNMDCVEFMKQLPDKYFSLCIADPPYSHDGNVARKLRAVDFIRADLIGIGKLMEIRLTLTSGTSCRAMSSLKSYSV